MSSGFDLNLKGFVERTYGLQAVGEEELSGGYMSRCFRILGSGDGWVLKSWTAGVAGPQGPARRRSLRLLEEMVALGPALRLPEPVRTRRGGLTVRLPRAGAALYRFLPGSPAPQIAGAPERLIEQIGQAAAEIHALAPRLTAAVTDRRPADGRLVRWMSGMLAVLPGLSSDGATRLRAAVGPQLPALSAQMEWLLDLRRVLPAAGRHVLRHGDLQGDNLVVDGSSLLGVLDWDEAALDAPESEFGLFLLDGGDRVLERVLNSYERAGGANDLDAERIEHAALERHLVDLAVRFERVLGRDPPRVQAALADVVGWGMERTLRLQRYRQTKTSGIGPESSSGRESSSEGTAPGGRSASDGEEIPFDSHGQKWMDHCQANSPSQCLRTNSAAILN